MKRIEINCTGNPKARQTIEAAGFKILKSLNEPDSYHIDADQIDLTKVQTILQAFGKTLYEEIDDGKRLVVRPTLPRLSMARASGIVSRHKGKLMAAAASAAAIGGALYYWL